ncbi:feruloyl-CoA synthase [Endozoicomonas arenosclerae]|uniref:feruloyl-CoA synthase n=1 Tax=Endozoicomonas arenosclerae TaxID=1633495 RepID=UPI000785E412|nr:feruloyl-CoA synthase [Endozoicomonas arenosclerae]
MTNSLFPVPEIERTDENENGFTLRSRTALGPYPDRVLAPLLHWAGEGRDRPFISQRNAQGGWDSISYGDMYSRVRSLAQALHSSGCHSERPVAILSENSINSATVILACIYAGIPVVPVSVAYSTIPEAFDRLEYCLDLVTPGAVYVEDSARFDPVIERLNLKDDVLVFASQLSSARQSSSMQSLASLLDTPPGDIDNIYLQTGPETVIKILFTSGSTGTPKGVINTNRMMSANQQQLLQVYPFLKEQPPVVLDWLPWSHTFGGNEVFTMTLWHGGHLYIDSGKPVQDAFQTTLDNLREVQPTIYFNVPLGYDMLATALEKDPQLNEYFFEKLSMLFYSASALPQSIRDRLQLLSEQAGKQMAIVTAWGATETAPLATAVHYESSRTDNIGVPVPGCEIRLARSHDRYELRVRGPQVTPGYWRNPEQTLQIFDENGFYKAGDAACLMDDNNPSAGILFDGRISEDFKLSSGTWVAVTNLRKAIVNALLPLAQDVVVLGQNRDAISILVFPNQAECQAVMESGSEIPDNDLLTDQALLHEFEKKLDQFNQQHTSSSTRVQGFAILREPPSLKEHEITEKGAINQRAIIKNREAVVSRLYSYDTGCIHLEFN